MLSYVYGDRSTARLCGGGGSRRARWTRPAALALAEGPVFADQQVAVLAFLFSELEEDLLALGVFEAVAIFLEEVVRSALALNADEQGFEVVDALAEPLGARGEQPVGRALEKQERRPRLELRVFFQQLFVALFERAEMLFFFGGELLENGP